MNHEQQPPEKPATVPPEWRDEIEALRRRTYKDEWDRAEAKGRRARRTR